MISPTTPESRDTSHESHVTWSSIWSPPGSEGMAGGGGPSLLMAEATGGGGGATGKLGTGGAGGGGAGGCGEREGVKIWVPRGRKLTWG